MIQLVNEFNDFAGFGFDALYLPTATIFGLVFLISTYILRSVELGYICAVIKSFSYFLYFGLVFDGTYTFLDDWSYLYGGGQILDSGISVYTPLLALNELKSVAGGEHFFYYLYNALAIHCFGFGYFSPVAFNIIVTAVIAAVGYKIVYEARWLTKQSSKGFFFFLLFHPDVFSWSLVMNGKDILVLMVHVFFIYAIGKFYNGQVMTGFVWIFVPLLVSLGLRFYVPFLFLVAFTIVAILASKVRVMNRVCTAIVAIICLYCLVAVMGHSLLALAIVEITSNFGNPFFGLFRFFLTPIPFNTTPSYSFLKLSAHFHWFMFPICIVGARELVKKKSLLAIFILIYFGVFLILYSVYEELQGPRHRIQLDFVIALLQFLGGGVFLKQLDRRLTSFGVYKFLGFGWTRQTLSKSYL